MEGQAGDEVVVSVLQRELECCRDEAVVNVVRGQQNSGRHRSR